MEETLDTVQQCVTDTLGQLGARRWFFQSWSPDTVYTLKGTTPAGFFEVYYEGDFDRVCAIATAAVRSGWLSFKFADARNAFPDQGVPAWELFDIRDGFAIVTGEAAHRSALVVGFAEACGDIFDNNRPMLDSLAFRLDKAVKPSDMIPVSRQTKDLSPGEMAALKELLSHPSRTVAEQAQALEISPGTLQKRYARIAAKFGVSSHAGAVVMAYRHGLHRLGR